MNIISKLTAVVRLVTWVVVGLHAGLRLRETMHRVVAEELESALDEACDEADADDPGLSLDMSGLVQQVNRRMAGIATALAEAVRQADARRAAAMRSGKTESGDED